MTRHSAIALAVAVTFSAAAARADVDLIARYAVPGTATDLSGLTAPLENGVSGNLLGGFGSAIAYTGSGAVFIALADRGPNAKPYNPLVDDTTSYIDRFHTFDLSLTPAAPGSAPTFVLSPQLISTTLLSSATPLTYGSGAAGTDAARSLGSGVPPLNAATGTYYFTARSDGFDPVRPSAYAGNARLDPEAVRVANDGASVFISDEYGPHVYQFDRATGKRIRAYALPDYYAVDVQSATGDNEIKSSTEGRITNRGMEGLAITPDGKTLIGLMQNPLRQDDGVKGTRNRIVTIDVATGVCHEYVYPLSSSQNGTSEILAVNSHVILVDERDTKEGEAAAFKKLFRIDLDGATDVTGMRRLPADGVIAVSKTLFLDLLDPKFGLHNAAFPQKIEGLAFGPELVTGGRVRHTLFVTSDNDFLPDQPSWIYVFAIDRADLPDFQSQVFSTRSSGSTP